MFINNLVNVIHGATQAVKHGLLASWDAAC